MSLGITPSDPLSVQRLESTNCVWTCGYVQLAGTRRTVDLAIRAHRIENNWYALTDRVAALKVAADGDLHIALQDATGDKPGMVVVEVPEKPQWCEIRNMVFSWTRTRFPFHTSSAKKLNVTDPPVITVIGKAFFDIGHAPKDQSNRRKYLADYAAWEIPPSLPRTPPFVFIPRVTPPSF